MKRIQTNQLFLLLLVSITFFSCSVNQFSTRKNFHPRVKIETNVVPPSNEILLTNTENISVDSVQTKSENPKEEKLFVNVKPKETIIEKITKQVFTKKHHLSDTLFHPQKKHLNKVQDPKMDGSQVAGLVIGLIALCFAIAAYMMIIVMANGGLWVGFIIGLLLAAFAITMGFIGKQLPFRGFSLAAGILGIIAVFVLMLFLILIVLAII